MLGADIPSRGLLVGMKGIEPFRSCRLRAPTHRTRPAAHHKRGIPSTSVGCSPDLQRSPRAVCRLEAMTLEGLEPCGMPGTPPADASCNGVLHSMPPTVHHPHSTQEESRPGRSRTCTAVDLLYTAATASYHYRTPEGKGGFEPPTQPTPTAFLISHEGGVRASPPLNDPSR